MAEKQLMDKHIEPSDLLLRKTLGPSYHLWEELWVALRESHGELTEEWKYYNTKSGWVLKTYLKKRNLFFFKPGDGFFTTSFVFGDKAVEAVEESTLPEYLKSELRDARKYMEGRGLSIGVKSPAEAGYVRQLVDIKVQY